MKKPEPIEFTIPDTNTTITLIHLPVKEKVNGVYQTVGWKPYMEVAQRLVWFNLVANDYILETEIEREWDINMEIDDKGSKYMASLVRFKATLKDPQGKVLRTARKTKELKTDKDYETCETGAIGRVLAYWGVGTQYATQDIEEGEDIADAPATLKGENKNAYQHTRGPGSTAVLPKQELFESFTDGSNAARPNEHLGGKADSKLSSLGATVVTGGKYAQKTVSEVYKEDKNTGFKWATYWTDEIAQDKKIPPYASDYLSYAEMME